ncbi:MAG: GGDEF domain-containing response regulator [Burkholderiaceae bacterium]|nr:MAG: GGDEF domain-containing response regulator [Burkholderiaceae bacterium]
MQETTTHILIVDDSEDDALLVSAQISRVVRNTEFLRVDTSAALRQALQGKHWDLIICDHAMPQFNSRAALEIVKALGSDIPFIIYSGQYNEQQGIAAMQMGARDFIQKDNPARLLPVIQRELSTVHLRRAKEQAEMFAESLSRYDDLTRLPSRHFFRELVEEALRETRTEKHKLALLYLDLDRFMRINDSFGYQTGDLLMQIVATRLKEIASAHILARLGQDEFAILLDHIEGERDVQQFVAKIAQRFEEACSINGQEFFLTFSVGACICPDHGDDAVTLIKNAESAMFTAKRQGGNRHHFYAHETNTTVSRRLRLENALRHALERNELYLAYQPILDLNTRRIVSTEALARWQHPEFGSVPPSEFIPIADETGLIIELGEWVLRTACAQTRQWHAMGFDDISVAVNCSATQFKQEHLANRFLPILRESGLKPEHVELEITESVAMHDVNHTIEVLRQLKAHGVQISIDDFGTGYSSLAYLKRFPIDILKIDKSFVHDITLDSEDAAIVRAIAALAKAMRISVLAEGVETPAQYKFLAHEGCHRVQGYFFSKPVPPGIIQTMLQQYNLSPAYQKRKHEAQVAQLLSSHTTAP